MYCSDSIYHKFFSTSPENYNETAAYWNGRHIDIPSEHIIYTSLTSYIIGIGMNLHNTLMSSKKKTKFLKAFGCLFLSFSTLSVGVCISLVELTARHALIPVIFIFSTLLSIVTKDVVILKKGASICMTFLIGPLLSAYLAVATAIDMVLKDRTLTIPNKTFTICPSNFYQPEEKENRNFTIALVPTLIHLHTHLHQTDNRSSPFSSPSGSDRYANELIPNRFCGTGYRLSNCD